MKDKKLYNQQEPTSLQRATLANIADNAMGLFEQIRSSNDQKSAERRLTSTTPD